MNRRDFLETGAAGLAGAAGVAAINTAVFGADAESWSSLLLRPEIEDGVPRPQDIKLNIKPVMTNMVHTDVWEGPCRWKEIPPAEEKKAAEAAFSRWAQETRAGLGKEAGIRILDPVHVIISEQYHTELTPKGAKTWGFNLPAEALTKIDRDIAETDVLLVHPGNGPALATSQVALHYKKPVLLPSLVCTYLGISGFVRSRGGEAYAAADVKELADLAALLRAKKVVQQTKVLFPTDRGLPAASCGIIWDPDLLQERLGVRIEQVPYREMAQEMEAFLADKATTEQAEEAADELLRRAKRSFIDRRYVVRSLQFYQTIRSLMKRHACNAFMIECFEFCPARLPQKWGITPCMLHALFQDGDFPSACEADLSALVTIRMLMSVARRSCHQGNGGPGAPGLFGVYHSAPSLKMNGFDQPDLPFQLGRFTAKGFGTKMLVDFMNNKEKTVTVARINPLANKMLVLRGELVGAGGWDKDEVGCTVQASIRAPEGKCSEFLHQRTNYGNHLVWVYGDYTRQLKALCEMLKIEVELFA